MVRPPSGTAWTLYAADRQGGGGAQARGDPRRKPRGPPSPRHRLDPVPDARSTVLATGPVQRPFPAPPCISLHERPRGMGDGPSAPRARKPALVGETRQRMNGAGEGT